MESDQSLEAQLVLASLVSACQAITSAKDSNGNVVDLTAACRALAGYDKTGDLNAKGGWLISEFAAYAPSDGFWSDQFDPAHPLTTPSHLNAGNPAIPSALADAVVNLQAHQIPLDASYGQVQHLTRDAARIPIYGCDTGCFNAIYAATARAARSAPSRTARSTTGRRS